MSDSTVALLAAIVAVGAVGGGCLLSHWLTYRRIAGEFDWNLRGVKKDRTPDEVMARLDRALVFVRENHIEQLYEAAKRADDDDLPVAILESVRTKAEAYAVEWGNPAIEKANREKWMEDLRGQILGTLDCIEVRKGKAPFAQLIANRVYWPRRVIGWACAAPLVILVGLCLAAGGSSKKDSSA